MSTEVNKGGVAPNINLNATPIKDINAIAAILPHRYPFLLVDKIMEQTDTYIVGVKNVTMNEPFFQGHFPNNPVMPGVLQIEAMAQCGGILCIEQMEPGFKYDTYFLKIDAVKFKAKVMPGDTLVFKCEMLNPIRRGICEMKAEAFVGEKLVCEAVLMAQLVKQVN
jgi:UDP-3-O-[3-hydroxymyristoyl] N-acetylglucosamine deacetylase / 3-hydroxyacyl-[acyl-carrier-protein] dehydratase